jgi:hypothetical protein
MKKLIEHGFDDHPDDDPDRARMAWAITVVDDCDACADVRVEITLEEVGRPGAGITAHVAPSTARRLRAALVRALAEIGEADG